MGGKLLGVVRGQLSCWESVDGNIFTYLLQESGLPRGPQPVDCLQ